MRWTVPSRLWCVVLIGHRYATLANDGGERYRRCVRCGKETELPYQGGANVGG